MKKLQHLFSITPGATLTPSRGLRAAGAFVLALLVLAAFGHTPFGSAIGLGFLLGVLLRPLLMWVLRCMGASWR